MATRHHVAAQAPRVAARNQSGRTDPTRTKTPRKRFAAHLRGRWNAIKYHVRKGVVERDAFNLTGGRGSTDVRRLQANVPTDDDLTPGVAGFDFPQDRQAVEAFADWLDQAVQREILEEYAGDQYLRQGHARGVKQANAQLRGQGVDLPESSVQAVLQKPVHRDKLQLIYGRAFQELRGVTDATAQEMRRTLAEGLAEGVGPRDLARDLNDRVERVGKTRATVLARTEVVRAHAEGTLDRYGEVLGDDAQVTPEAEILVAGDRRTCPECQNLSGNTYSLEDARGIIPVHPRCRCAWTLAT